MSLCLGGEKPFDPVRRTGTDCPVGHRQGRGKYHMDNAKERIGIKA